MDVAEMNKVLLTHEVPGSLRAAVITLLYQNPVLKLDGWTLSEGRPTAILKGNTSTVEVYLTGESLAEALTEGNCGHRLRGTWKSRELWSFDFVD